MPKLSHSVYGKQQVRLTKVKRLADRHELIEITVGVLLMGAFDDTYLTGDNAKIIATDTMRNTVYALATNHPLESIETFARDLADHFVGRNAHVSDATVTVEQDGWDSIATGPAGAPHPHAFVGGGREQRTCNVQRGRISRFVAGVEKLDVLKTADSAFAGFLRDEYTTLPETDDRIFATTVGATWQYADEPADFNGCHAAVRRALLETFATHKSRSVQQTLYAMGEAALAVCREMVSIRIGMPNRHRIPFDLSKLGLENRNEIFVPTPEPYGAISAELTRD